MKCEEINSQLDANTKEFEAILAESNNLDPSVPDYNLQLETLKARLSKVQENTMFLLSELKDAT